jgi:hypothetical protein
MVYRGMRTLNLVALNTVGISRTRHLAASASRPVTKRQARGPHSSMTYKQGLENPTWSQASWSHKHMRLKSLGRLRAKRAEFSVHDLLEACVSSFVSNRSKLISSISQMLSPSLPIIMLGSSCAISFRFISIRATPPSRKQ